MATPKRPATPIRRLSGSLRASSQAHMRADTPLAFLQDEALQVLAEETTALQGNLEQLHEIHGALATFNESFATFLYGVRMNAFCVEWPEAPSESSLAQFERGHSRAMPMPAHPAASHTGDATYRTDADDDSLEQLIVRGRRATDAPAGRRAAHNPSTSRRAVQDPASSRRGTQVPPATHRSTQAPSASRRATPSAGSAVADEIIDTMPLEYRHGDSRALLQSVILALIAAADRGVRVADVAKPPDMPAGKVNKALIALLAANHVLRASLNGTL
ncbi:DASH complex subunit dam1 [Malassezia sp. CBS 17886]|nr:DASH complex subunit dam1 [Malassezia sp. CBS 17886]